MRRGMAAFVEVGQALARIRDERLYRSAGFDSFAVYCNDRWGLSQPRAYQAIDAAQVSTIVEGCRTESQARELAPLLRKSGSEAVRDAWQEATDRAAWDGRKVTAEIVREVVREKTMTPDPRPTIDRAPDIQPAGPFGCIVADPPWAYNNTYSTPDSRGGAAKHYPTMSLDDICNMDVAAHAAEDCYLFLWATNPLLREAFCVIDAWGFEYLSVLTWAKVSGGNIMRPRIGSGHHFRSATEHVLLGRIGNPKPLNRATPTWFAAERAEHSRKPDESYRIIEAFAPGPYLELFARRARPGWAVWGNEVASNVEVVA